MNGGGGSSNEGGNGSRPDVANGEGDGKAGGRWTTIDERWTMVEGWLPDNRWTTKVAEDEGAGGLATISIEERRTQLSRFPTQERGQSYI